MICSTGLRDWGKLVFQNPSLEDTTGLYSESSAGGRGRAFRYREVSKMSLLIKRRLVQMLIGIRAMTGFYFYLRSLKSPSTRKEMEYIIKGHCPKQSIDLYALPFFLMHCHAWTSHQGSTIKLYLQAIEPPNWTCCYLLKSQRIVIPDSKLLAQRHNLLQTSGSLGPFIPRWFEIKLVTREKFANKVQCASEWYSWSWGTNSFMMVC